MSGGKHRLRMYIGCVVAAAFLLTIRLAVTSPSFSLTQLAIGSGFVVMIALAGIYPIHLSPKTKVSVSTAAVFAAILFFEPLAASTIAAAGVLIAHLARKRGVLNTVFSVGQTVLFSALAGITFRIINPGGLLTGTAAFAGMVAAALVLYMVNSVSVALAAGLQTGHSPVTIWLSGTKQSLAQELALASLGFVGAVVAGQSPAALAFILIPVVVIYQSFKRLATLNEQVKNQLDELKVTQAQLVESARLASIGTMVAGIAHQINNPMFVIRGRAETLLLDAAQHLKSDQSKKHVQTIYEMADRVSRVINSLLPASQVTDAGTLCSDVNECVRNAVSLLEPKILKGNVSLKLELQKGIDKINGEACEIQELIVNLVDNACNAMSGGGTLLLKTEPMENAVLLLVADSGTGISAENIDRVFSPFFSTRKGGGGIGLGLYVARHIAQKHGGDISLSSQAGKGSVFSVLLPTAVQGERRKLKASAARNDIRLRAR